VAEKSRKFPLRKRILLISFILIVGIIAFPFAKGGYYFGGGLTDGKGGDFDEKQINLNSFA
jgi:hypothetical protein